MASMLTESYNFDEHMEVDNKSKSDLEDGEVSEDQSDLPTNRVYENDQKAIFSTGIDIFTPEIQEKLCERAKRFNIDPKATTALTDDQITALYNSLGLSDRDNRNIRFDAIHIRGTENMSTEDVFRYFELYGPATIEWIDDYSCNVVWLDKSSAARALRGMSRAIKGLSEREKCNNTTETNDSTMEDDNDDSVDVNSVNVPIPPGHWRLGHPTLKANCVLLRYATDKDKKQLHAEKASRYYKKHGNPNYGGMRGIITDRKRQSFYDDADLESGKKNPWGDLSKMWASSESTEFQKTGVSRRHQEKPKMSRALKDRIGIKREIPKPKSDEDYSDEDVVETRSKIPRMKMYADEEELKQRNRLLKRNNRYEKEYVALKKPDVKSRLGNYIVDDLKSDSYESDEDKQTYGSIINVIRPNSPIINSKPSIASTISRNTIERRKNNTSESSEGSENEENSRESSRRKSFSRPGFDKADLRSRLSNKSIYKNKANALKVEIDNEYYSD